MVFESAVLQVADQDRIETGRREVAELKLGVDFGCQSLAVLLTFLLA